MSAPVEESDAETSYEIKWSKELGRYLVAVRDIQAREIIIREDPLISGPSDRGPKGIPVCLGCCCVMLEEPTNRCTSCYWPVCNEDCEKLPSHSTNECNIFRKNRVRYPPPHGWPYLNRSILILRCLLLKENPTKWNQLMSMSDNEEIRKCKPNCITADKRIVENFAKFYPDVGESDSLFTEVIHINGIIDTNAHAFPLKVQERSTIVCNLYSRTSLMAHSCKPNASWSPDKSLSSLTLTIRANLLIPKGSMISVAYDEGQLLVSTLKRLVPNEIHGMFICKCERCLDPTEFGTYIGALKCPECERGYLLPTDPVDSFCSWKCDSSSHDGTGENGCCDLVLDDETVMEMIEEAESICGYTKISLGAISTPSTSPDSEEDDTLELLKDFAKDYGGVVLHPNHYILQEVNVRILRKEYEKGLSSLSSTDLILFLERCDRLLGIADILTPGYCEYRAFLHFHFSQGLLALERRKESESKLVQNHKQRRKNKRQNTLKASGERDHNPKTKQEQVDVDGSDSGNCGPTKDEEAGSSLSGKLEKSEFSLGKSYGNSENNLRRVKEMLTFLLGFFRELNSSHRLLEPINETLEETEMKLERMKK